MTDDTEQRPVVESSLDAALNQLRDFGIERGANRSFIRESLNLNPERNYVFTRTIPNPAAMEKLKSRGWVFDVALAETYLSVLHLIAEGAGLAHTTYPLDVGVGIAGQSVHVVGDAIEDGTRCDPPFAIRKRFEDLIVNDLGVAAAEQISACLENGRRAPEVLFLKYEGIDPFNMEFRSTNVWGEHLASVVGLDEKVDPYQRSQ